MKKFPLIKNKNFLGVFAHPDDESFGPSGLISFLAKNNQFYLAVVTNGQAGKNYLNKNQSIALIRKKEVKKSAQILGVKKIFFLNYKDGYLSNKLYHQVSKKVNQIIEKFQIEYLITYEPLGVSGHIDHIFVSMISSYIAEKNKQIKNLFYYCLSQQQRNLIKDYFIYFPPGYKKNEIDYYFDFLPFIKQKINAIKTHQSQKKDLEEVLKNLKENDNKEYFLAFKKQGSFIA